MLVQILLVSLLSAGTTSQHFANIPIKIWRDSRPLNIVQADKIGPDPQLTEVLIENQSETLQTVLDGTFNFTLVPKLRTVQIKNCSLLTWIQSQAFDRNLSELKRINLNFNGFRNLPGGIFDGLHITTLYLVGNSIEEIERNALDFLPYLETLDLSRNKLQILPKIGFVGTHNLRRINLSHNGILGVPDYFFRECYANHAKGSMIDLSHNRINHLNSHIFEGIRFVEELLLNDNRIEQIDHTTFARFKWVSVLNLERNSLRFLYNSVLKSLQNSSEIYLQYNNWSCDFVRVYIKWCIQYNKFNDNISCKYPQYLGNGKIIN